MSDKCGNCDCADRSQCVKKGNQYGIDMVETHITYVDAVMMDAGENDGKCKCGTNCSCTGCSCGH